ISTAARLLNASELNSSAQPLEVTRVRIESRLLSPSRVNYRTLELQIVRSVSREDAERTIELVRSVTGDTARAVSETPDKWKVVITTKSPDDAEALTAKLEDAGFEVQAASEAKRDTQASATNSSGNPTATA